MTETKLVYELKHPTPAWLLCAGKAVQIRVRALYCGYDEFQLFDLGDRSSTKTKTLRGHMRVWGGFSILHVNDELPLYSEVNECYLVLPDVIITGVRFMKEESEDETVVGFVGVSICGPTVIKEVTLEQAMKVTP